LKLEIKNKISKLYSKIQNYFSSEEHIYVGKSVDYWSGYGSQILPLAGQALAGQAGILIFDIFICSFTAL